jgi:small ligand-binding sensory domain FIST
MRDTEAGLAQLRERFDRTSPETASAAVLFQCLGRASADHLAFATAAGAVPLVGFHCNGEVGPLGGSTHLHSFTAAFGLLRRKSAR